jgi:hypothetical protein
VGAQQLGRLQDFLPVAQELRVFHESTGLCGTLDFLGWHVPTQQLYVLDWKTNKAINSDRDTIWRMMWGPFKDLADHEHNTYSLQISLYRVLLEEAGLPTGGGAIVHLPPGRAAAQVYKAIDYRSRLRDVIFQFSSFGRLDIPSQQKPQNSPKSIRPTSQGHKAYLHYCHHNPEENVRTLYLLSRLCLFRLAVKLLIDMPAPEIHQYPNGYHN